jgi:hypothetical protein
VRHSPDHNVIVQIKVKLLGVSKPPVWRRLQLRADTRLDELHQVLQTTLGWLDCHLHVFTFDEEEFGDKDGELGHRDERRVTIGELTEVGTRFRYTYDFGDDWEHEIVVEDLLEPVPGTRYPVLVAAKGACPPEDCGGRWGYAGLKEALADPAHEEHEDQLQWLGLDHPEEFDPISVPIDDIANELALTGTRRR